MTGTISGTSWLANPHVVLRNFQWAEDDLGSYWVAEAYRDGQKVGWTGSYYDIERDGKRLSREAQEAELREMKKLPLDEGGEG